MSASDAAALRGQLEAMREAQSIFATAATLQHSWTAAASAGADAERQRLATERWRLRAEQQQQEADWEAALAAAVEQCALLEAAQQRADADAAEARAELDLLRAQVRLAEGKAACALVGVELVCLESDSMADYPTAEAGF